MRNYVLLTGATGLLGQYLVRDLLRDDHHVAVLIRATKSQTAAERLEQIMQMWEREAGTPLRRPIGLTGDINQENLGLSAEELAWVKKYCKSMMHCAASLQFAEHKGEPWQTNVEGTKNVLELCRTAEIKEMHYISTAYVCGHRHDLVMEDDLDVDQEFRNIYEKSKFTAEKAVREYDGFDKLTVYRPVVITGDSKTGYTSTYHGTYLYMKLASVLTKNSEPNEDGKYHIPVRWGLTGKERRNITAVDWNSEVICRLFAEPKAVGRTFHLGPSDPITMKDAIDYASEFYGLTGIEFRGTGRSPDQPLNEMERWLWSNISIYGSYDFMDPEFDTTNLKEFAGDIDCPPLDYEMASRLMEYAESDRWGKRKKPTPEPAAFSMESHLGQMTQQPPMESETAQIGFDVLGIGGGQWTVTIADDKVVGFERGLASEPNALLRISATDLENSLGKGADAADLVASNLENKNLENPEATARKIALAFFFREPVANN